MKQRICSMILVVVLFFSSIGLEGCGANNDANNAYITQGEWIALINEAFGMYGYVEEEPYYTNIPQGSTYYEQIQIAREWEVIDGSVTEFDTNAYVTYAFAAVTLINATGFVDEEVTAGEKVSLAEEWGFIITEEEYEIEDYISYNDAVVSLYFAKNQWANLTYDHVIEEVAFKEEVINYIEEDFTDYKIIDGKTYIPVEAYTEMEAGDVYTLPANAENLVASAFKIENVTREGDYYVIENSSEKIDIFEYIEELKVEETYTPDLLACNFYDGNDNLVYEGSEYAHAQRLAAKGEYEATNLLNDSDDVFLQKAKSKTENSYEFKVDDKTSVQVTFTKDSVKFGLEYEFAEDKYSTGSKAEGNKDNAKTSAKMYINSNIYGIEITDDIDFGILGLKKARVALNYKSDTEVGITSDNKTKLLRPEAPYNNANGGFLTNLKKAAKSELVPAYARGAEGISGKVKIGTFDLASIGIAKVKLIIYVYAEADGTISVKLTYSATKGIEYSKGNVRFINEETRNTECNFKASLEGGLNFELELWAIGCKLAAAELKVALGLKLEIKANYVDAEGHLIETGYLESIDIDVLKELQACGATISLEDMVDLATERGGIYVAEATEDIPLQITNCLEIDFYLKVKVGIKKEGLLGGLVKEGALSHEWTFPFLSAHVDDLSDISSANVALFTEAECTHVFTPFESAEPIEIEGEVDGNTIIDGEYLIISECTMVLEKGEIGILEVDVLPEGYSLTDLVFESGDNNIATVTNNGIITATESGVTYIKVYIPNTKYEMRCAIIVSAGEVIPFSPIKDF